MMPRQLLLLLLIFCSCVTATALLYKPLRLSSGGSEDTTTGNICARNATIGAAVVAAVNLSWPGLQAAAAAAAKGDLGSACGELALYFSTGNSSSWLRLPPVRPGTGRAGGQVDDLVGHDIFYLGGVKVTAKVPRNTDGGIDWLDHGPRGDQEFSE
jgi:hypothetical protein